MKNKDYKIEMVPTIWEVKLEKGCYSSLELRHLYFRANSVEEVWHFLCRYIEDLLKDIDYISEYGQDILALNFKDEKKTFISKRFLEHYKERWDDDFEADFSDTDYGIVWGVKIKRLDLINFNK